MPGIPKKIDELPVFIGDLTNDSVIPIVKDGVTYQIPVSVIRQLLIVPPLPTESGYDVWIIAGQSNAQGAGTPIDATLDYLDPRVLQYALSGSNINKNIIASDSLKFPDAPTTTISAGSHFGRNLINILSTTRKVLLIPVAVGSTGLISGDLRWQAGTPGGDLYELAISATNAAIAANPGSTFKGILWAQGETEAFNSVTQAAYTAAFGALITGFRSRITEGSASLLLIGSMVPQWVGSIATRLAIDNAHREIPLTIERSWFVPGVYVDNAPNGIGTDKIHYSASALREMGRRYFLHVDKAARNLLSAIPPVPILSLGDTPANTADINWTIPPGTYAYSYEISVSLNGAAYSVVATNVLETRYRLLGLTLGANYSIRVRSRLVGAYSGYSNLISYTPSIAPTILPSALPGAWFDIRANESRNVAIGSKIEYAYDTSGNGRHFYQFVQANKPSLTIFSGLPTIETIPANYLLGVDGSFPNGSSYTKLVLIRFKDFANAGAMLSAESMPSSHILWRGGNPRLLIDNAPPFTTILTPVDIVANVWYAIWATYDSASGQSKIYQSDLLAVTGTLPNASASILSIYNSFDSSGNGNNAYCLRFATWNTVLSLAQIQAENTVMENNYGITLTN